jgi:catechol 2,3-dioxygenase-like lactoylglutathione lyase family enzyme
MFSKITTNLMVGDVNEALAFYEGVLGFRLVMGVPEGSRQIVTTRDHDKPYEF